MATYCPRSRAITRPTKPGAGRAHPALLTHASLAEVVAKKIIEHARRGERNPTRLREIVLKELQSVPCKRAITPLATCSSCSVEPRFMRRAACMGMLATVSRNMKVCPKNSFGRWVDTGC
jgi:hypothetical protein